MEHPCLACRGRTFYFRVAIPRNYWRLTKCHEIGYSLRTCSYEQAVRQWRFIHLYVRI